MAAIFSRGRWVKLIYLYLCSVLVIDVLHTITSLIARFMGPTWGPSGADRTQVGPKLAPWTLPSGMFCGIVMLKPQCICSSTWKHISTKHHFNFLLLVFPNHFNKKILWHQCEDFHCWGLSQGHFILPHYENLHPGWDFLQWICLQRLVVMRQSLVRILVPEFHC